MLIAIWDWLFTRRQWKVIKTVSLLEDANSIIPFGTLYILQDQFGNIKKKRIRN